MSYPTEYDFMIANICEEIEGDVLAGDFEERAVEWYNAYETDPGISQAPDIEFIVIKLEGQDNE